jgi:hypothetical protein
MHISSAALAAINPAASDFTPYLRALWLRYAAASEGAHNAIIDEITQTWEEILRSACVTAEDISVTAVAAYGILDLVTDSEPSPRGQAHTKLAHAGIARMALAAAALAQAGPLPMDPSDLRLMIAAAEGAA